MTPRILALALLLTPAILHAQATRTWVSGVGDDANPGTRTAPCKTFAGAISKTAASGLITVLDPGGFGVLTITKAITIDGNEVGDAGVLAAGTNGFVINAGVNDVIILRNLSIEGLGTGVVGVDIRQAGAVHIENCQINGFSTAGIRVETGNAGAQVFIKDTIVHKCLTVPGLLTAPTAAATVHITNSHFDNCGSGVSAGANTNVLADTTSCAYNAGPGFATTALTAMMSLARCGALHNQTGIQSAGTITIVECNVANNTGAGLQIITGTAKGTTGVITSLGNNTVTGNNPNGSPSGGSGSGTK